MSIVNQPMLNQRRLHTTAIPASLVVLENSGCDFSLDCFRLSLPVFPHGKNFLSGQPLMLLRNTP